MKTDMPAVSGRAFVVPDGKVHAPTPWWLDKPFLPLCNASRMIEACMTRPLEWASHCRDFVLLGESTEKQVDCLACLATAARTGGSK